MSSGQMKTRVATLLRSEIGKNFPDHAFSGLDVKWGLKTGTVSRFALDGKIGARHLSTLIMQLPALEPWLTAGSYNNVVLTKEGLAAWKALRAPVAPGTPGAPVEPTVDAPETITHTDSKGKVLRSKPAPKHAAPEPIASLNAVTSLFGFIGQLARLHSKPEELDGWIHLTQALESAGLKVSDVLKQVRST